jgi:hypothetical protein
MNNQCPCGLLAQQVQRVRSAKALMHDLNSTDNLSHWTLLNQVTPAISAPPSKLQQRPVKPQALQLLSMLLML